MPPEGYEQREEYINNSWTDITWSPTLDLFVRPIPVAPEQVEFDTEMECGWGPQRRTMRDAILFWMIWFGYYFVILLVYGLSDVPGRDGLIATGGFIAGIGWQLMDAHQRQRTLG